jgi:hypothetical protein
LAAVNEDTSDADQNSGVVAIDQDCDTQHQIDYGDRLRLLGEVLLAFQADSLLLVEHFRKWIPAPIEEKDQDSSPLKSRSVVGPNQHVCSLRDGVAVIEELPFNSTDTARVSRNDCLRQVW